MRLKDLKNWNDLTPKEQARLKKVYGEAPEVTKTMHDTTQKSLHKAKKAARQRSNA